MLTSFLIIVLVLIPLAVLGKLLKALMTWRRVPLQTKNQVRAGAGAFAIVLSIGLWARGVPATVLPAIGGYATVGLASFGLLYLVVGVHGAHGARFDFMSAFWWSVAAIGCATLLWFEGPF